MARPTEQGTWVDVNHLYRMPAGAQALRWDHGAGGQALSESFSSPELELRNEPCVCKMHIWGDGANTNEDGAMTCWEVLPSTHWPAGYSNTDDALPRQALRWRGMGGANASSLGTALLNAGSEWTNGWLLYNFSGPDLAYLMADRFHFQYLYGTTGGAGILCAVDVLVYPLKRM